jgi:hypothetical protein
MLVAAEWPGWRPPRWQTSCIPARPEGSMLLFLAFMCLLLWLLGFMTTYTLGGVLHILLVIAVVFFLIHIIQGSSVGNA